MLYIRSLKLFIRGNTIQLAENFCERKLPLIRGKYDFCGYSLVPTTDATFIPNFRRENFCQQPQNLKIHESFLPLKFSYNSKDNTMHQFKACSTIIYCIGAVMAQLKLQSDLRFLVLHNLSLICYQLCLFSLTGDTVCVALPEWGNFVLALCL